MKIGITERGDAALDLSWAAKLDEVDGAILITKNCCRKEFVNMLAAFNNKPLVLHATCTGMGGTQFEPNVPDPKEQLLSVKRLIDEDVIPAERVVIRIDPIFPSRTEFLETVLSQANLIFSQEDMKKMRYRVSVMDFYPHVKERLAKAGFDVPTGFTATREEFDKISKILGKYPNMAFETCAENSLNGTNIIHTGCVGKEDICRMELDTSMIPDAINGQNRRGCMCLTCKTELLSNKHRCPHGCLYCYWKD